MADLRLIITGSREYDDDAAIEAVLERFLDRAPDDLVLVHGEAGRLGLPCGPEQAVARWAQARIGEGLPVIEEVYPAAWKGDCVPECTHGDRPVWQGVSICPQAGERANAQMVAAGADAGLAALLVGAESTRAKDCLRRMVAAGIAFEMVVKGTAVGLPDDLLGRRGQGHPAG